MQTNLAILVLVASVAVVIGGLAIVPTTTYAAKNPFTDNCIFEDINNWECFDSSVVTKERCKELAKQLDAKCITEDKLGNYFK